MPLRPKYLLKREGTVFSAIGWSSGWSVFRVHGAEAAKAAIRLLGIKTPIQDCFFDSEVGTHHYNTFEDLQ